MDAIRSARFFPGYNPWSSDRVHNLIHLSMLLARMDCVVHKNSVEGLGGDCFLVRNGKLGVL